MAGNGKKEHKILKRIGGGLAALVLMGLVYVAAVLIQSPADALEGSFVVQEEYEPVTRMQPVSTDDAQALVQLFGAPLPFLPGYTPVCEGTNAVYDGQTVRVATVRYDGLVISAVRPASAAPLLLRPELSVSLRSDLTVLNLPAVLSGKGNTRCVSFSNESAAYTIYAPNAEEEAFLSLLERIQQ